MAYLKRIVLTFLTLLSLTVPATAQSDDPLVFATVHRPPFADTEGDQITGFSIDLMRAIADQLGHEVVFEPNTRFGDMLSAVRSERVDGAIANISITAERERTMDFSQPIFGSGIKIIIPNEGSGASIFALFTWDIALVVLRDLDLLFFGGLLLWFLNVAYNPISTNPHAKRCFPHSGRPSIWSLTGDLRTARRAQPSGASSRCCWSCRACLACRSLSPPSPRR